jgi:hypothetical protein
MYPTQLVFRYLQNEELTAAEKYSLPLRDQRHRGVLE